MFRILALLAVFGSPAHALSCMAPDPATAFGVVAAAPDPYWIVVGKFTGGPKKAIKPDPNQDDVKRTFNARFTGHNVNRHGLANPIDMTVVVEENCFSAWCSSYHKNVDVLTFLRLDPNGPPVLELDLCGSNVFVNPTAAQMQAIQNCFVSGCALPN